MDGPCEAVRRGSENVGGKTSSLSAAQFRYNVEGFERTRSRQLIQP